MEKNPSEDNDSSFEMFDPLVTDSMSIVAIPESPPVPDAGAADRSVSFNLVDNPLTTNAIDSVDGLPSYDQIRGHQLLAQTMSAVSDTTITEERNASLKTLNDNLERIEDNVKNGCSALSSVLSTNLEIYLKELKTENDKLKSELEKNNLFMKQQLKNLQEWQNKNKDLLEEHKQVVDNMKLLSEENKNLKEETLSLKQELNQRQTLESDSIHRIQELTKEVEDLRIRCSQMASYEKLNISSELRTQELTSGLVDSQLKIDTLLSELKNRDGMITTQQQQLREAELHLQAKDNEIATLQTSMNEANHKLDAFAAMEAQIQLFERDFKMEHMMKLAALQETEELKNHISELECKLDKGEPVLDLQEEKPVGKPHRKSRRSERLGRRAIPVLNVGAVLKGFKQYKTTSDNV